MVTQLNRASALLHVRPRRRNQLRTISSRTGKMNTTTQLAGAGCGVDGWKFFMPAYVPRGSWSSTKAKLVDVPEPTGNCPSPATAFTQWRIELASMYFLLSGVPTWQPVWTIISEHYAGPSIAESTTWSGSISPTATAGSDGKRGRPTPRPCRTPIFSGAAQVCISTAARGGCQASPALAPDCVPVGPTSSMIWRVEEDDAVSAGRRD